ncbi:MAG: hypothetical protein J6S67_10025 [Methanobrevibacter sp.]|nr:hypothetical protein [Methanobrevibacter sp.]
MTENEFLETNKEKRTLCECWTRVMGYFRPMSDYNKGKKSEFKERKWFTEDKIRGK